MLDEHVGSWSFSIFEYCIRKGTIFPQLIKDLLKSFWKTKWALEVNVKKLELEVKKLTSSVEHI